MPVPLSPVIRTVASLVAARYSAPPYLILEHRVDAARRNLALAATDPANPYGAALPWPALQDDAGTGHRPGRKAGALVVLVDGAQSAPHFPIALDLLVDGAGDVQLDPACGRQPPRRGTLPAGDRRHLVAGGLQAGQHRGADEARGAQEQNPHR
mgnify:CR=1 FL=1